MTFLHFKQRKKTIFILIIEIGSAASTPASYREYKQILDLPYNNRKTYKKERKFLTPHNVPPFR
jgi:hypothetical protein